MRQHERPGARCHRSVSTRVGSERAQATVELALVLPLVAVVMMIAVQLAVVTRDSVALVSAARAGARHAMIDPSPGAVLDAARAETGLDPTRMSVGIAGDRAPGGRVIVNVTYRSPTDTPLVGRFVADVVLRERFVVRRE